MSSFGALEDHFGLADSDLVLVDSEKTPVSQTRADARDENNDIAAAKWHGNTAEDRFEISCTYALKSGTKNLNTFKVGELEVGKVADSFEVSTDQNAWPQFTVSGMEGTEEIVAPDGKLNTFTLPDIEVKGAKRAQPLGFTVTEGRLTSCSVSASIDMAQQEDGEGEVVADGLDGGVLTISAEFVRITDQPAWDLTLTDAEQTQGPGKNQPQAEWHTASAEAEYILERDSAGS